MNTIKSMALVLGVAVVYFLLPYAVTAMMEWALMFEGGAQNIAILQVAIVCTIILVGVLYVVVCQLKELE